MIDTIVITLPKDKFQISKPELFSPNAAWLYSTTSQKGMSSKQNPTNHELAMGVYKPRLTLFQRQHMYGSQPVLKIELSLPKLLHGNNFEELRYKDFNAVTHKLLQALADMGVIVDHDTLITADVSAIHYGKNIKLTDGSTPYHYIKKIQEASAPWYLDANKTDFRNDGHSYKWHCNSYEIVFYDKIRDLEKAKQSGKRAVEKDSALQLNLLNKFKTRKKLEYLRMEVRLNKRAKMKQLFAKLGIKVDLTLKKLFKPAISKKILLHYLDELESKRPPLLDYKTTNDRALLADLIFNNPESNLKQIMQLFGMKKALETINVRELRMMFANCNPKSWQRLMAEVNKVKTPLINNPFKLIREKIMELPTIKLKRKNRNQSSLPEPVMQSFMHTLLSIISEKNGYNYKIVKMKPTGLKLSSIKISTPNRQPKAYKVFFQKKDDATGRLMEQDITIITSQSIVIPHYTEENIKPYDTLREFEDAFTKQTLEQEEKEFALLYNQKINDEIISKIQHELSSVVKEHIDLLTIFLNFNGVTGFAILLEKIIEGCHYTNENNNEGHMKGSLYELFCAYHLTQNNEKIEEFSKHFKYNTASRDFDLVTASGKLIECKYTEASAEISKLVEQSKIAKYHKKEFVVYFAKPISKEFEQILKEHEINFKILEVK